MAYVTAAKRRAAPVSARRAPRGQHAYSVAVCHVSARLSSEPINWALMRRRRTSQQA